MKKLRPANPLKPKNKGQSLVELTLVLTILITLMVGMVEFGYLFNQYINLVDGAREGARFAAQDDPFTTITVEGIPTPNYEFFFLKTYQIVQGRYDIVDGVEVQLTKGAIDPIVLSKANHDDIVVTFFSVYCYTNAGGTLVKDVKRFESTAGSRYNEHSSRFSDEQIKARIDCDAPNAGILLVEVFYNYHQILRLGSFLQDENGNGVLDPILVHTYSFMPLSSAEPTPTEPPSP